MSDDLYDQPLLTTPEALDLLTHGEISRLVGLLPWGSNHTFLVEVRRGTGAQSLAVYKPAAGERPLWDFPDGTLHLREYAAFLLSEALGWRMVPPTVVRGGPHGEGSLQYFIPHDPEANYFTFGSDLVEAVQRIALFDQLANNADRKAGHCLLDVEGHVWGIDHGLCFNAMPKLRTVIWDFAGERIPPALLADVEHLCGALSDGPAREAFRGVLDPREVDALQRRTEATVRAGTFVKPGSGRSYPWPPV